MAADVLRCALERQASLPQIYTHGKIAARPAAQGEASRAVLLLPSDEYVSVVSVGTDGSELLESCLLKEEADSGVGHPVTCVAIAPRGLACALVATRSGHCYLFDLTELSTPVLGKTWRPFGTSPAVAVLAAFDPSGTLVALGSADGAIRIVDTTKGFATHAFQLEDSVGVSAMHLEQETLFVGDEQGHIRHFDLISKKQTPSNAAKHTTTVTGVFPVRNQTASLVSTGRDRILKSISLTDDHQEAKSFVLDAPISCGALISSESGKAKGSERYVVVGDETGTLKVFDWAQGVQLAHLDVVGAEEDTSITAVCVLAKTKKTWQLVCSTGARTIVLVNFHADKTAANCSLSLQHTLVGNIDEVYDVAAVPGSSLLCLASNSHAIRMVNTRGIQDNAIWPCVASLEGHTGIVLSIDCSGSLIASSSRDKKARVWRYDSENENATPECVGIADGHSAAVGAVALSNGRHQSVSFIVTGAADKTVKLWPFRSDRERTGDLQLTAKWTVLAHDKDINCVAVAPDDRIVASGSQDKSIRLWGVDSGEELVRCTGHRRGIWSVAFSPVDRVLASASGDHSVRIWSVKTGACLRTFEGHGAAVLKVMFGPKGTSMFSSDSDGILKAWSVRLGECTQTVDAHGDRAWSLSFIDDDEKGKVVSAGADATVHLWVDMSDEKNAERQAQQDQEKLQSHAVDDAVRRKKWRTALKGALELDKPRRMFSIMTQIVDEDGPVRLSKTLMKIVSKSEEWTRRLLTFCKDWNTSNSSFMLSQIALKSVLEVYTPSDLADMFGHGGGVDLVEALIAYTARHYKRLNQAHLQVSLVDFVLQSMKGLDNQVEVGNSIRNGNGHTGAAKDADLSSDEPTSGLDESEISESESEHEDSATDRDHEKLDKESVPQELGEAGMKSDSIERSKRNTDREANETPSKKTRRSKG